jgi:hypothetical protein
MCRRRLVALTVRLLFRRMGSAARRIVPASAGSACDTAERHSALRCIRHLLADLAEAVIGKRVNAQGALESVSSAGFAQIRQRVASLPRDADFTRWLDWLLADRSTRTISPNSPITVSEYITRLLEQPTLAAAREAVLIAPTNTPALAHLSEMLLASPGSNSPVLQAEAASLLRRAESLGLAMGRPGGSGP